VKEIYLVFYQDHRGSYFEAAFYSNVDAHMYVEGQPDSDGYNGQYIVKSTVLRGSNDR
jgi:hypothetical protein